MRPFKPVFEKKVNENMEKDGRPGPACPEAEDAEMDIKKGYLQPEPEPDYPPHDSSKKDRPPRFSTLFGTAEAPLPTPLAVRRYQQEYYPRPQRKSGVFMPWSLFILFAVILFFETTIIFAYTVIGLYNNAPSRLIPWAGPGPVSSGCNCDDRQSGINFAPNFIMPGPVQAKPITQILTVTAQMTSSTSTSTSSTTTTTSTTSTTSTASTTTSETGPPPGVAIVTVAPPQSTVTMVTLISVDPEGQTLTPTSTESSTTTTISTTVDSAEKTSATS